MPMPSFVQASTGTVVTTGPSSEGRPSDWRPRSTATTVRGPDSSITVASSFRPERHATWVADTSKLSQPMGYEFTTGGYVPSGVQPRYRVRFIYQVSGTSYTAYTFLDLVRQPFRHSVLPPDVDAFSAGFFDRLGPDDRRNQGERVITEAARQVKEDLRTRGIVDWGQRNSDFLNGLVVRKAVYVGAAAAFQNGAVDDRWMTFADKTYQSYLDRTLAVSTTQATAGGAATKTPDAPLWTR